MRRECRSYQPFLADLFAKAVITGFNTDIEFQGTTYHVQTEDKGVKTPLILSLVYDRGTILASKRSAYDDLLIGNFDEKQLSERLQKQHNLICAAVRTGRIEDLKRMTTRESASKQKAAVVEKEVKLPVGIEQSIKERPPGDNPKINEGETSARPIHREKIKTFDQPEVKKTSLDSVKSLSVAKNELVSKPNGELIWDVPISVVEEPIIEAVQVVEELILSDEAVEIITDYVGDEPTANTKLKIKLLNDEKFRGGERKTVAISVNQGDSVKGLSGAQVMVKILGSSFRPLIFHAKTDDNGIATVHLQLPQFKYGRAALLIKAMNEGEEADLRRVITHN